MSIEPNTLDWLLAADEPWVRLGALRDLCGVDETDSEVRKARKQLGAHRLIRATVKYVKDNPKEIMKNHKSAKHMRHQLAMLAALGVTAEVPGMKTVVRQLLSRQAEEGAFQTWIQIPKVFGGDDVPSWAWMLCDAPLVLDALRCISPESGSALNAATQHLLDCVSEVGWRCGASFPKFKGPGRRDDPCPYATLLALRALA